VSAYLEEKAVGRDLRLHCVLFNVDDYDKDGAIPGRYASITKTADSLRFLAHCTGGRFHWFRETGIIESDDIRLIMSEIDKAVNFSRRAKTLIDAVRSKYEEMFPDKYPKALGGAAARSPSFVRDALDSEPPVPKALGLRPGAASSVKAEPLESVRLNRRCVKSAFYTGERNRKGQVISDYQGGKSVRKAVGRAEIPDKEDQVTSKAWFKRYSLAKLGLDLYRLVSGPDCRHEEKLVKPLGKTVSAKYCSGLFPTVNVRGVTKHLQYTPVELQSYDAECVRALKRYLQRLHWLLSGSRRLFGVVVETRAVFLVDVSGSMAPYMEELKLALKALVWEQLYKFRVAFNLIAFSSGLRAWSPGLEPAEEDSCHAAVAWIDRLESMGNTATLEALEAAFATKEPVDAIYLLTDGKPDTSTSTILRSINRLDAGRNIAIHTISFNCCDATANNFLQCLASETGGRYHKVVEEFDAKLFAHRLLEESQLDDPRRRPEPAGQGDRLGQALPSEVQVLQGPLLRDQAAAHGEPGARENRMLRRYAALRALSRSFLAASALKSFTSLLYRRSLSTSRRYSEFRPSRLAFSVVSRRSAWLWFCLALSTIFSAVRPAPACLPQLDLALQQFAKRAGRVVQAVELLGLTVQCGRLLSQLKQPPHVLAGLLLGEARLASASWARAAASRSAAAAALLGCLGNALAVRRLGFNVAAAAARSRSLASSASSSAASARSVAFCSASRCRSSSAAATRRSRRAAARGSCATAPSADSCAAKSARCCSAAATRATSTSRRSRAARSRSAACSACCLREDVSCSAPPCHRAPAAAVRRLSCRRLSICCCQLRLLDPEVQQGSLNVGDCRPTMVPTRLAASRFCCPASPISASSEAAEAATAPPAARTPAPPAPVAPAAPVPAPVTPVPSPPLYSSKPRRCSPASLRHLRAPNTRPACAAAAELETPPSAAPADPRAPPRPQPARADWRLVSSAGLQQRYLLNSELAASRHHLVPPAITWVTSHCTTAEHVDEVAALDLVRLDG
uniref:VWFA domain-containing protein n=1 Tax=Macrostomum lignano TaxID=282301 RepID=A0A1I8IM81_9PLAT